MSYRITPQPGYLRADLLARETAQQTSEFLEALADAALKHRVTRILINVQSSRPIFKVEQYSASAYLKELARRPWLKVALVATQPDLRSAHEYVEVLAGQQGASLRSFADTASAIAWLQAVTPPSSETQSQEKR
jgi:hypothetical protein